MLDYCRPLAMGKNSYLIDLSESSQIQTGKVEFAAQSHPQKVFSAIWDVEAEVNNGGFWQYFANNSAETASFVVEALGRVGASRMSEICKEGLPADTDEIQAAARAEFGEDIEQALDQLSGEFCKYPENLTELLFEFVKQHPNGFGEIPDR